MGRPIAYRRHMLRALLLRCQYVCSKLIANFCGISSIPWIKQKFISAVRCHGSAIQTRSRNSAVKENRESSLNKFSTARSSQILMREIRRHLTHPQGDVSTQHNTVPDTSSTSSSGTAAGFPRFPRSTGRYVWMNTGTPLGIKYLPVVRLLSVPQGRKAPNLFTRASSASSFPSFKSEKEAPQRRQPATSDRASSFKLPPDNRDEARRLLPIFRRAYTGYTLHQAPVATMHPRSTLPAETGSATPLTDDDQGSESPASDRHQALRSLSRNRSELTA